MSAGLPRVSRLENVRFTLTYAIPSVLRGTVIPMPFWTELMTRLNTRKWGVDTIERLVRRHGGRSVLLRSGIGETILVLSADDARRILSAPIATYGLDAPEKTHVMEPFAPDTLSASPPALHAQRRPFNEAVLDYGHEPHRLATRFLEVSHDETSAMLANTAVIDYERWTATFRRIARRIALGDAAADDVELSREHALLREDGNWLGLARWNRRRGARLRMSLEARIQRYVDAAEPGSLVSLFAAAPTTPETNPVGQVAFWLMALEAAGVVVSNTLAVLATHAEIRARVLADIAAAGDDRAPLDVAGLPFVRACFLDSIRLWPPAPALVRRTATTTDWEGTAVPAGTRVLIPAAILHRTSRVPYANRFAPEIWLDGSGDADWLMNPFSRGGAQCGGRNLALVLGTATLADLLRQAEFRLERPRIRPGGPLPYGINPLKVRFAIRLRH
jgi:cytochrome P450